MSFLGLLTALLLSAPAVLPAVLQGPAEQTRPSAEAPTAVVDINEASEEDFVKLPGIGSKLARRILTYRRKHGPFRRVEDLLAIRGIGTKKWKAIRPYLRIGNAARKGKPTPATAEGNNPE
jgi:competence protein ComEA